MNANDFEIEKDMTDYGGIKVSGLCIETYPCQHYVEYDNIKTTLFGTEVYKLFEKKKLPVPKHFLEYKNKPNF